VEAFRERDLARDLWILLLIVQFIIINVTWKVCKKKVNQVSVGLVKVVFGSAILINLNKL